MTSRFLFPLVFICGIIFPFADDAYAEAIRTNGGFSGNQLGPTDDGSTGAVNLGFNVNFFGATYNSVFVNNNGNITLNAAYAVFTPIPLSNTNQQIIAPFFADVDTTGNGNPVTYGTDVVRGHPAFGVSYVSVDYFNSGPAHGTQLNSFQVVVIDRSDYGPGDADIELNYNGITWETGDASGGNNGLGGNSARAGISSGAQVYEISGSAINGAFLDSNLTTGLANTSNIGIPGRWLFLIRGGKLIIPGVDNLVSSANSGLQRSAAKVFDSLLGRIDNDLNDAITEIYTLDNDEAKRDALEQIGGYQLYSLGDIGAGIASTQLNNIREHCIRNRPYMDDGTGSAGFWFNDLQMSFSELERYLQADADNSIAGSYGDIGGLLSGKVDIGNNRGKENQIGYDFTSYSIIGGIDYSFNQDILLGAAVGYAYSDADFYDSGGGLKADGITASVYNSNEIFRNCYLDSAFSYGFLEYKYDRNIQYGTRTSEVARGEPDGHQLAAEVSGYYGINPDKIFSFGPLYGIKYIRTHIDSYTENDAGGIGLIVDRQSVDSLTTRLGGYASVDCRTNDAVTFTPEFYASWVHELMDDNRDIDSTFIGAPSNVLAIPTDDPDRDYFDGGIGLSMKKDDFKIKVDLNLMFSQNEYIRRSVTASLNLTF